MPLKITRRAGQKNWYITGTVAGVRVRESTETTSKAVAEAYRIKRESELEQRRIYGPQAVATFAAAVNLYLDRNGEDRFLTPLLDHFGAYRLSELTQAMLDTGARKLYPDAKPSTLNRQAYTPFIAVMNEAAINDLCPYRKWRRPKGHAAKTKFRWLWPSEFESVYAELHSEIRPIAVFMAGTGARSAEALNLDWSNVSLATSEAWIWETKSGHPRKIELPSRVVTELANLTGRKGKCFGERKGFRTAINAAIRRSGVDPFSPHDLRHTFATWHYSVNLDRERLKALGGWKSDQVDRYCHLAPRGLASELKKYGWNLSGTECAKIAPTSSDVAKSFTSKGDKQ